MKNITLFFALLIVFSSNGQFKRIQIEDNAFESIVNREQNATKTNFEGVFVKEKSFLHFDMPFSVKLGLSTFTHFIFETNTGYISFKNDSSNFIIYFNGLLDDASVEVISETLYSVYMEHQCILEAHHILELHGKTIFVKTQIVINQNGELEYGYFFDAIGQKILKHHFTEIGFAEILSHTLGSKTTDKVLMDASILGHPQDYYQAHLIDDLTTKALSNNQGLQLDLHNKVIRFITEKNPLKNSLSNTSCLNHGFGTQNNLSFVLNNANSQSFSPVIAPLKWSEENYSKTYNNLNSGVYVITLLQNNKRICQQKIFKE